MKSGRVALIAALVAALACGRKRRREGNADVDPRRLPQFAACSGDCDQVLLEELRAAVRGRPKLAVFGRHDSSKSPAVIEANLRKQTGGLLRAGWKVRDRPFQVQPPIDWGADPFGDRNWRFQLSSLGFLPSFLQLHAETGDREALRFARSVMLDWIDFNLVSDRPNDFEWYDHATGLRATRLAYLLDASLRGDELTASQLRLLLRAAREHVVHLSNPRELASNNHALFQLAGLAGVCTALPELAGCDEGRAYAAREFARIVDSQFTAEGIHTENSPSYQGYALESIDLILSAGWLEVSPDVEDRLALAWRNLPWLVRPDGLYARIGDSSGDFGRVQRAIVRQRADAAAATPTHRAFPASGYAVVRAPSGPGSAFDGFLFLAAAFNSKSHKHRDSLSFEWFDAGAPILIDTGAYSANRDAGAEYVRSSRAHNTIEVDEIDIDGGEPRAPVLMASAQLGDTYALAGEVSHPELATRHRRILVYAPGRWLLVHDEVNADTPRTITAWFHLPADAAFRAGTDEVGVAEIPQVGSLRIVDLSGKASASVARGQTIPRLHGWVVSGYGQLVENDAIGLTQEGTSLIFDTLFLLETSAKAISRVAGGSPSDLCWTDRTTTYGARISVSSDGLRLTACDVTVP